MKKKAPQQITELTEAQRARFPEFVEKWVKIGLCTDPADRPRAESSLDKLYALAKLPAPAKFWLPDPIAGAIAARAFMLATLALNEATQTEGSLVRAGGLGHTPKMIADNATEAILPLSDLGDMNAERRAAVFSAVSGAIESLMVLLWDPAVGIPKARSQRANFVTIAERFVKTQKEQIVSAGMAYFGGSLWAAYPAWADYFNEVCEVDIDRSYLEMTQSCGFYWTHSDVAFLTERPSEINRDERGRLHSFDKLALRYGSWGLPFVHGIAVPEDIILDPAALTVARIEAEKNAEVRRVMIEKYDLAKYLIDSKAERVQSDDFGTLLRKKVEGDEDIVMVQVVNSTEEPDGTFKDYFLRVPPTVKTAREGVAWSNGVADPSKYSPAFES